MPPPEVSGRALLGLLAHLKEKRGPSAVAALLGEMPPALKPVFASRVLHANWYPYEAYVALLKGIAKLEGPPGPAAYRALGASSGVRDLNTVFRIYVAIASTERLIRSAAKVWASYYRHAGAMEAVKWSPEETVLRVEGFPQMAPEHCALMEGWMISTMKTLGAEVLDGRESKCTSRGDPVHEFTCRWRKL